MISTGETGPGSLGALVKAGTRVGGPRHQGGGGTPCLQVDIQGRDGWGQRPGSHHMLVVEQVHDAGRPLAHGHQVGRGLVEPQQTQGRTLLHAVHAVPVGTPCGGGGSVRPQDSSPAHLPPLSLLPGGPGIQPGAALMAHVSAALWGHWQNVKPGSALIKRLLGTIML